MWNMQLQIATEEQDESADHIGRFDTPTRRRGVARVARCSDVKSGWTRSDAIANLMLSGGWLIEQHTLRTHRELDRSTEEAVRGKDLAVAGAMLTNVANLVVTGLMKRRFPDGSPGGAAPRSGIGSTSGSCDR